MPPADNSRRGEQPAFPGQPPEHAQDTAVLRTTLYDMAYESLKRRSGAPSEPSNSDAIYRELNRIMTLNGYKRANIDGKTGITDADLPVSWNGVRARQKFKLTDGTETVLTDRQKLERKIWDQVVDETSTVPVKRGEGYYQVLERMHPDWTPERLSEETRRIKRINGNRDVLKEGERLPTATDEERKREWERRVQELPPESGPTGPPERQPEPVPGERTPTTPREPTPTVPGQGQNPLGPPERPNPTDRNPPGAPVTPVPIAPIVPPFVPPAVPPVGPAPGPPAGPPALPPAATELSMAEVYARLRQQHMDVSADHRLSAESQGFIGRAFDSAKNNIGASGEGRGWYDPRKIWSQLFDSDLGSTAIREKLSQDAKQLDEMKAAVQAKDESRFNATYQNLTGQLFDKAAGQPANLTVAQTVASFDDSQKRGVDTTTDIGAGLVAALSLRAGKGGVASTLARGVATGAILGGSTKAGLMQADGTYANFGRDFALGALVGGTVPIGELAGAQLSRMAGSRLGMTVTGNLLTARIETQGVGVGTRLLSASLKSGTSGSVFGAIESPGREVIHRLEKGESVSPSDLVGLSIKGAAFGFVGGTIFGAATDRAVDGFYAWRPKKLSSTPQIINGVEVPRSGVVGMDDAATILKLDPADFKAKATTDPYGAVDDAVKLYEQTGLNIRKGDPLTGAPAVPDDFSKALSMVQNVDALTADASLPLRTKVQMIKSADEFIGQNQSSVDDAFTRITADPNFQEVSRLKAAEHGPDAARQFENKFRSGFEKDVHTSMSVDRIRNQNRTNDQAFSTAQSQTEAAYKQKAADFFKDMTDPVQRQRLNDLVDDIYTKFNPELLPRQAISDMLDGFSAGDRELAVALLNQSASVSSDSILKARLQAVRSEITSATGTAAPRVYTIAPDSSGNLLGYLYRKSNSMGMEIRGLDHLADEVAKGNIPSSVTLFDDLASTQIGPAEKQLLQKIPEVYVVDVGAFEKAVNVIDLSKGPVAVSEKLQRLVAEAKQVQSQNAGLIPTGVAQQVLSGSVDQAAAAIGPNVKVIRPTGTLAVPNLPDATTLSGMPDVDALYAQLNVPKATKSDIANFLTNYAGEERELAARMLADGAVHNSFPMIVQKSASLFGQMRDVLSARGMNLSDLILISDKDPGGSTHLISYLFGRVNGLSHENFISSARVDNLIKSGAAKSKAIAYLDDTVYSGSQTTSMLNDNISALMPFKRVIIGSLGAYETGLNSIRGTHLSTIGQVDTITAGMHHPFYSSKNPFYSQLPSASQWKVKNIGGSEGFGGIQGSLIWSYMYPDNNLTFFGSQFSGSILHLPGP